MKTLEKQVARRRREGQFPEDEAKLEMDAVPTILDGMYIFNEMKNSEPVDHDEKWQSPPRLRE